MIDVPDVHDLTILQMQRLLTSYSSLCFLYFPGLVVQQLVRFRRGLVRAVSLRHPGLAGCLHTRHRVRRLDSRQHQALVKDWILLIVIVYKLSSGLYTWPRFSLTINVVPHLGWQENEGRGGRGTDLALRICLSSSLSPSESINYVDFGGTIVVLTTSAPLESTYLPITF